MTVGSIIGYPMRIRTRTPGRRDARIRELLELVGLSRYQASWYPTSSAGASASGWASRPPSPSTPSHLLRRAGLLSRRLGPGADPEPPEDVRREFNLTILIVTHN